MSKGRVTVVLDAQAGSCGKGKVVGYMATHDKVDLAINNFMSNAGHTFVEDDGRSIMTQHLPTSIVNPETALCIGPGAAITLSILEDEINKFSDLLGDRYVFIHPRAVVITDAHAELERQIMKSGSTMKGCGTAQADKIMRKPDTILMRNVILPPSIRDRVVLYDTAEMVNRYIDDGGNVLVEGSQGFDLDINYGLDYPYTTSRQCHAGQLVADCGISPRLVDDIIMVMRPYPIRISSTAVTGEHLNSGDYAGSREIAWNDIRKRCGAPDDANIIEMTTVTKKIRRVFEMNWGRLRYAVKINRPTGIVINFAQYIDWKALGVTDIQQLPQKIYDFMLEVENNTGVPVMMVGTGAKNNEMVVF